MNKKAQMMMSPRKIISWVLGLLMLALGGVPLLNSMKVISFAWPTIPNIILWIFALAGGVFLLIDAIKEGMSMYRGVMMPTLIVGLVVLALGLIPLLNSMGVIAFNIPQMVGIVMDIIYVVAGILLIIGGVVGF